MKKVMMKNWISEPCTQDEIATMIQGTLAEVEKGDTNYSVYIGGDTLVFANKDPDGRIDIIECQIRRSNLDQEDVAILTPKLLDKSLAN